MSATWDGKATASAAPTSCAVIDRASGSRVRLSASRAMARVHASTASSKRPSASARSASRRSWSAVSTLSPSRVFPRSATDRLSTRIRVSRYDPSGDEEDDDEGDDDRRQAGPAGPLGALQVGEAVAQPVHEALEQGAGVLVLAAGQLVAEPLSRLVGRRVEVSRERRREDPGEPAHEPFPEARAARWRTRSNPSSRIRWST